MYSASRALDATDRVREGEREAVPDVTGELDVARVLEVVRALVEDAECERLRESLAERDPRVDPVLDHLRVDEVPVCRRPRSRRKFFAADHVEATLVHVVDRRGADVVAGRVR